MGVLAISKQPEGLLAYGELPRVCSLAMSNLLACPPFADLIINDLTDCSSIPHSQPLVMSSTLELTNGKAADPQPPFHWPLPSQTDQAP